MRKVACPACGLSQIIVMYDGPPVVLECVDCGEIFEEGG